LTNLLATEVKGCKDIRKILESIDLIVDLLAFKPPTRTAALKLMFSLMINRYPKVRQVAAEQLYVSLITFEDILANVSLANKERVLEIVSNTQWESPVDFLKKLVQTVASLTLSSVPKPLPEDEL
jgi:hypothetical protein